MSFAQQKQRQYSQLSTTLHKLCRELELTRNLMDQTSIQLNAMGKFAALHAAQMMAVETVEVYVEGHGHLPGAMKASDRESDKASTDPKSKSSAEN
ncbi:hypothetical protein BS47DRAFT_973039 [Hydnum rufescens UP504]|uniref:Uncharacterized protein n=1 Tax=Hydnum rufescens UP504 TaxID=1448309 RepID=A0A9P6AWP4_9AGAM|nr:hypothetical protein BS47DRAFT_973039 [Hydnum rufescens UP504]